MSDEEFEVFLKGMNAYEHGQGPQDNPHSEDMEKSNLWERGWYASLEDEESRNYFWEYGDE